MDVSKDAHLDAAAGPKRILGLDGGGIRGLLTLEYLAKLEAMLAERYGANDFKLCNYFDLIGGTSTGAIIAAALACGLSVAEVKSLYQSVGKFVFKKSIFKKGILTPKYDGKELHRILDEVLGADTCLDSQKIQTGLLIMTKRLDSDSPWPVHNHPNAVYAQQDSKLYLTDLVCASAAAPTYFKPERIEISKRDGTTHSGAFVDGGVSPFNEPALQLLLVVTSQGHGFRWSAGADQILLVSVGTGTHRQAYSADEILSMPAAQQGLVALQSLMNDCARVNQTVLQWITKCLTPWTIDRTFGDMGLDSACGPQLATYIRYNALLQDDWLTEQAGFACAAGDAEKFGKMDTTEFVCQLTEIGAKCADKQIRPDHFATSFDIAQV